MPSIKTECKEVVAVASRFAQNVVSGKSKLSDLRYIGPSISKRAFDLSRGVLDMNAATKDGPHHIKTINDLVRKASQARTASNIDRLLEHCTFNDRRGTCVPQTGKPDYQVPDVNVCGYNTLLAVLQYAHTHKGGHEFPNQFNLAGIARMKPRDRGHAAGSRFCSCVTDEGTCHAHGGDCLWKPGTETCHSRSIGRQPGFLGKHGESRNAPRLGQKIAQRGHVKRGGEEWKGQWRLPKAGAPPDEDADEEEEEEADDDDEEAEEEADDDDDDEAEEEEEAEEEDEEEDDDDDDDDEEEAEEVVPPGRRYPSRNRKGPDRLTFGGGHAPFTRDELRYLDNSLRALESFGGGRASDARRFRNFAHLTSGHIKSV